MIGAVSVNPSPVERRAALDEFVRYRREHLVGDEKGEAQVFVDRFFRAFGHDGVREAGATLEMRVARRDQRGTAFADLVWKPRVLIEMKRGGEDLARHYRQAFEYWIDLVPDRPQYVVLCNFDDIWVYDLNQQLDEPVDRLTLDDLPRKWDALAFLLPRAEQPVFANNLVAVTRETAAKVSAIFNRIVTRGVDRTVAQRFILQAVMAMFAEDIALLPRRSFTRAIEDSGNGGSAYDLVFGLFREMNEPGITAGGRYEGTPYFNGGLFREVTPFELSADEVEQLYEACQEDWAQVRPVIFGTLFEQSLDRPERHAYGAYFTSEADIQKVVLPTIVRPWRARIESATTLEELGDAEYDLLHYRVLDPACGSGNFLYVGYREMRRLERMLSEKVQRRRRARPGELRLSFVSTAQFYGIDARPFAVEVAKITLMLARKLAADELGDERVVLPLDDLDANFATADAIFTDWPPFDACIGNPPYLGRRRLMGERGAAYVARLQERYPDIGGVSDYVSYWFRKTHDHLPIGGRAGLVGTNTIRQGDTRPHTLDYIVDNGGIIHEAVASQPWSGDATVDVSIVNWAKEADISPKVLWLANGTVRLEVDEITGSLSPEIDLRAARSLGVNTSPKVTFQGQTPGNGGFVLTPDEARDIVRASFVSAEVIFPYLIGQELPDGGGPSRYIIDIPDADAALARRWGRAFEWVRERVLPARETAAAQEERRNREVLEENPRARVNTHHAAFLGRWWQHSYRRPEMVEAIERLPRYIALSRVAVEDRPSIYEFVAPDVRPGDALQVFAFSDDYSFGILNSRLHRRWFEQRCSTMRVDLRYTSRTVWNSFPWPQAPDEEAVAAVVTAVAELLELRTQLAREGVSVGEQYESFREPGRNALRARHESLDDAVMLAYGFRADEDDLAQLLALNESIWREETEGTTEPRRPGPAGPAATTRTTQAITGVPL